MKIKKTNFIVQKKSEIFKQKKYAMQKKINPWKYRNYKQRTYIL